VVSKIGDQRQEIVALQSLEDTVTTTFPPRPRAKEPVCAWYHRSLQGRTST
jgi:hypothetical protein